ncbi:hypothetical protein [Flavobacterium aquicola]|uniref:Uncharacterized protein n=1 Tax=Flavobacterium aquicola TaxID=1682742 RepID=A0A3E0EF78_9FLAO|nr:hypothetical protein [Flavobacterium aquicola]REG96300.1 hypothetical protein C8P67_110126 [Flavobacterium aquicola]
MKPIYYTFLAAAITITSCKNNDEEKDKSIPKVITPFTQQTAVAAQTNQQTAPSQHNLFHENNAVGTSSVAAGVNPAHGQPNHRCDIPVGAPLNSPVNGTAAPQTNQVQVQPQMQTITQSVAAKTPKGMNPPHGQPNHRCDIPVGAPLNSKPATTATTATTSPPSSGEISKNITVQQPVPALLSTSATNTETPEGMNPPHGQAGHRCDIAVGAPLPKS